jgi:hypothetical protein
MKQSSIGSWERKGRAPPLPVFLAKPQGCHPPVLRVRCCESWRCPRLFCVPESPLDLTQECRASLALMTPGTLHALSRAASKRAVLHAFRSVPNAANAKSICHHRKPRARRLDRRLLTVWGSGRSRDGVSHHGVVLSLLRRAGTSQIQRPNILLLEIGTEDPSMESAGNTILLRQHSTKTPKVSSRTAPP